MVQSYHSGSTGESGLVAHTPPFTLGQVSVVAIGNGNNDVGMLAAAGLGIAVLGPEGTASRALTAADLVAGDICSALELLLFPQRLFATLRY